MSESRQTTAEILIVESDSVQLQWAARALRQCAVSSSLHIARDAAEASRRIQGAGGERPVRPTLVILGDGSTTVDYMRFLFELRSGEAGETKAPVIALLPPVADRRTLQTCQELANCCLRRPETQQDWLDLIDAAETLWLSRRVETEPLPPRKRSTGAGRSDRKSLRSRDDKEIFRSRRRAEPRGDPLGPRRG